MTDDIHGFMNLRREIETVKCSFDMETDVVLSLPTLLISANFNEVSAEDAVNIYQKANGNADLFLRKPNYLLIPAAYFREVLMGPTILSTYKHVASVLDRNSDIRQVLFLKCPNLPCHSSGLFSVLRLRSSYSRILLIGNFANCRMLQDNLMKFESRGLKVLIPRLPGEAVVKGTHFGMSCLYIVLYDFNNWLTIITGKIAQGPYYSALILVRKMFRHRSSEGSGPKLIVSNLSIFRVGYREIVTIFIRSQCNARLR